MINVSDEFYNLMQVRTNFLEYATVILQDNTEFNLTPADFTITNNSITDGAGSNALPLGVAVEKLVQIEIANPDEKYNEYDFYGAVVDLQIRFQLSNSVETLTRGVYTVIQPAHYGDTIIITAADDMYKADKLISGTITFPTTLGTLATVLCTATDITLASSTFTNSTLTINSFSGDITQYTYRQLFGFIAQLAGGNARINYDNKLEFITYNKSKINTMVDSTDGDVVTVSTDFPLALTFDEDPSTFQDMSILLIDSTSTTVYSWAWSTLQTYINDHTITLPTNATIQAVRNVPCILEVKWLSLYDGVWHSYRMLMPDINREIVGIEVLDKWNNLTVETDDIEITGIKTVLSAEQLEDDDTSESDTVLVGTNEYVLEVSNPMLNYSNASTVLANVATLLVGLKLRPFSGDHVSNPIIEFMDPVFVVNKRGRTYASIITDVQFNVLGYTTVSNSAEPKLRNGQVYSSKSSDVLLKAIESSDKKVRAINNYFWHDLSGAHVSTVENDATTGPNVLIDANGYAVRENTTELVRMKRNGITFNGIVPFMVGNNNSYVKWVQENGTWKIKIAADAIEMGGSTVLTEQDEITITNIAYAYQLSTSGTTVPTGTWSPTPVAPTTTQYAWTRTTITYSTGDTTITYTVGGKQGTQGATGPQGAKGDTGTGISAHTITYGTSDSAAVQPTNWSSTVPTSIANGKWLWTRTVTTYTDGTSTTAYSKSYIGTNGADGQDGTSVTILGSYNTLAELQAAHPTGNLGDAYMVAGDLYVWNGSTWQDVGQIQGPQGPAGADGTSITITKIEYGTSDTATAQPSSWSTTAPTSIAKGKWLWVRTTYSDGGEATTKSYVGTDGTDGTSVYVQSATKTGNVTTVVLADSEGHTTTLSIIDGEDGVNGTPGTNGLNGYVHTAWANSADGSQDFSTTVSAGKSYFGSYTDNTAADSTRYQDYSWSLIKGAKGDTGATGPQGNPGTSVTVSSIRYAVTTSESQPADGLFIYSSVPTVAEGSWLWTRTTYSDGTKAYTKAKQGVTGPQGATGPQGPAGTGVTITSTTVRYQTSSSGTTIPTGTWQTSVPSVAKGNYLWTRTIVNYSDNNSTTSYSVAYQGEDGTDVTSQYLFFVASGTYAGLNVKYTNYDNRVNINASGVDIYGGNGNKTATFGSGSTTFYASDGSTVAAEYSSSGMTIYGGGSNGIEIAHLGYASGTSSSGGTSVAPYITLGYRTSDGTIGNYSVSEGYNTTASAYTSHAEGKDTIASGYASHTEGAGTEASNQAAHAEGYYAKASGTNSHAEGYYTKADGFASHAEGYETKATANYTHAGGLGTTAGYANQTVIGKYNSNSSTNIFEVGSGTSSAKKNAFAVDASGNIRVNGKVYVGCNNNSSGGTALINPSASTSWTTPTIVSSAVSSVTGGYYTEGSRVYVQLRCSLAAALSADTTRDIFSGLPKPKSVTEVALNCLVRSRAGNTARLYASSSDTTAKIMLIADPDHAISANQNVAITGVYTIN